MPAGRGEDVPLDALNAFLRTAVPSLGRIVSAAKFSGGFSNLTYELKSESGEKFVLRRPPRGIEKGPAHDMAREFRILGALADAKVAAPRPFVLCEDAGLIGAPFYIMEHISGIILHGESGAGADTMHQLGISFVETLVDIHRVDVAQPGIAALGRGEGYVARQIDGWSSRWERAKTGDIPELDGVAEWLAVNQPGDSGVALIHNDFKYDNLVLNPQAPAEIRAVLDWEMATVGDPLMDLGTSLGYWVEAGDHPAMRSLGLGATAAPGNLTRRELWEGYLERTGRPNVSPRFYYVYGLFKIAVIAQQIYARYKKGLTADERFAKLGTAVQLLGLVAASAAQRTPE